MGEAGRYELLDRIAQGGMAELYRARAVGERGVSKLIAIKRLRPESANDQAFVDMMIEEARLAADLSHPNLVQLYELGRDQHGYFIAMELVNGPSLATLLRRLAAQGRTLPESCALDIVIQLLNGLDYAHRKTDHRGAPLGLVHRDVSPENLLLTTSGTVKLVDFGIAKAATSPQLTVSGAPKGKPRYMSPEQARGKRLDGRSDLFSAALVLWECLLGRPRFDGKDELGLLWQVAQNVWTPPSSLGFQLAPALEAALERALATAPEARFPAAADFARELARHHRRAYPDYVPQELGELVQELYGADLALREEKLRRLETGVEQIAGLIGNEELPTKPIRVPAAQSPGAQPSADAEMAIPTEPQPNLQITRDAPAAEQLRTAPDSPPFPFDQPAPGKSLEERLLATPPAAVQLLGESDDTTTLPASIPDFEAARARPSFARPERPAGARSKGAEARSRTAEVHGKDASRGKLAEARAIDEAIATAKAADRAEAAAARKVGLPVVLGTFLAVGAVSGGLMAWLDRAQEPADPTAAPATAPQGAGKPAAPAETPRIAAPPAVEPPANAPATRATARTEVTASLRAGQLDVTCEPECEVLLQGKIIGHSPMVGHPLPAGRHRVLLRSRLANLSKSVVVEISPDRTTALNVNLVLDP